MADPQTPAVPAAKTGGETAAAAIEAARSAADAGARQAKDAARASETAGKTAAEALGVQTETSQAALQSGFETGARSFEGLAQSWAKAFSAAPGAETQPAQNVRAVSEVSSALAKGAQDASQAWLELTQKAMRTNLEAFGRLSGCRTVQDLVSVQSNLIRENLQNAIEGGEAIARAHSEAIRQASRAMQFQVQTTA